MSKVSKKRAAESSSEGQKKERTEHNCVVCYRPTVVFVGTDLCAHFVCSSCYLSISESANPNQCPECKQERVWTRNRVADNLCAPEDPELDNKIDQYISGAVMDLGPHIRVCFKNLDKRTIADVLGKLSRVSMSKKSTVGMFENLEGVVASCSYSLIPIIEEKAYTLAAHSWQELRLNHHGRTLGCICVDISSGQDSIRKTLFIRRRGEPFFDNSTVPLNLRNTFKFFEHVNDDHVHAVPASPVHDDPDLEVVDD